MSRLARSCLLLPLLCGVAAAEAGVAAADDRMPGTTRRGVRQTAIGFVIVPVAPSEAPVPPIVPLMLGRSVRIDHALFERPCRAEKGASDASAC